MIETMADVASGVDLSLPGGERPRRLRATPALRRLVRETRLHPAQLIAPLFVVSGRGRREEIASLRGHARLSPELVVAEARRLAGQKDQAARHANEQPLEGRPIQFRLVNRIRICEIVFQERDGRLQISRA